MKQDWDTEIDEFEAFVILRNHFTIREALLRLLYPLPSYWKKIAWCISLIIIFVCGFAVIHFGNLFFLQSIYDQ